LAYLLLGADKSRADNARRPIEAFNVIMPFVASSVIALSLLVASRKDRACPMPHQTLLKLVKEEQQQEGGVFGPEDIAIMTEAFDLLLAEFKLVNRTGPVVTMSPPGGRSSPAGAGSASRSSRAPPRGVLDARTRGTAPSAFRYAHHSTRNTGRERLNADRGSSYARARAHSEGHRAGQ
jgi:hypothetical protein